MLYVDIPDNVYVIVALDTKGTEGSKIKMSPIKWFMNKGIISYLFSLVVSLWTARCVCKARTVHSAITQRRKVCLSWSVNCPQCYYQWKLFLNVHAIIYWFQ